MAVAAKFRNAGQICASPTRFYVQEAVYDQFVDLFVAATKKIKVGNGLNEGVTMGPLIAERRLEVMEQFVTDAVEHGATLATGGKRIGNLGYYYAPTVLANVGEDARIMNEEPFGPVAPIAPFKDFDQAVERANKLEFGLAAYAFTSNGARAAALAAQINSGTIAINSMVVTTPETPFGGVNDSGYGSEGGPEGLDAYLRVKFVSEIDV